MAVDDVERRHSILSEFQRRRRREILALIPFFAALVVGYTVLHDPTFEVAGLGGMPLLVAVGAVIAVGLVHHLYNWRCPVCKSAFLSGVFVRSCKVCDTSFAP